MNWPPSLDTWYRDRADGKGNRRPQVSRIDRTRSPHLTSFRQRVSTFSGLSGSSGSASCVTISSADKSVSSVSANRRMIAR